MAVLGTFISLSRKVEDSDEPVSCAGVGLPVCQETSRSLRG